MAVCTDRKKRSPPTHQLTTRGGDVSSFVWFTVTPPFLCIFFLRFSFAFTFTTSCERGAAAAAAARTIYRVRCRNAAAVVVEGTYGRLS